MNFVADDGPIFFLHIMKTGGTTLGNRLARLFSDEQKYPFPSDRSSMIKGKYDPRVLFALPPDQLAPVRFYSLHQPLWVRDQLASVIGVQPYTLTVLRDPVERMVSHLKQLMRKANTSRTLEEFYSMPRMRNWICWNYQMRQFVQTREAGEAMRAKQWEMMLASDPDTREVGHPYELGPAELERAKQALATVDAVGFTDNITEFVDSLSARFGWAVGSPTHLNAGPPMEIPSRLRSMIEADSAVDIEFYEYARETVYAK